MISSNAMKLAGSAASALLLSGAATAQTYPTKPVQIFTTAAGGGGDFVVRQVVPGLTAALGQPIIVENRPQGFVAAEAVAKAAPDGYALTMQGRSFWITPLLRAMNYDAINDFAPITTMEKTVGVFVVNAQLPASSIKDLIALAKAKPGALNYATSAGVGSASHIAMESFSQQAGIKLTHVPYKGNAPAIAAVASGEVQLMISDATIAKPQIAANRVVALAITNNQPSALMPGVPTVASSGLPGFDDTGLSALFAPARTPIAIIRRLNQEVAKVMNQPDIKERFIKAGTEATSSTPEELSVRMKTETAAVAKLIKDAGIKAE